MKNCTQQAKEYKNEQKNEESSTEHGEVPLSTQPQLQITMKNNK